jgi:hypothetical protein
MGKPHTGTSGASLYPFPVVPAKAGTQCFCP